MKRKEDNASIHYPRIPLDYRPMMRFSMDIKHMPPSRLGFSKLVCVCVCEFSNRIVGIPIADEQALTIAESLYHKVICQYGTPTTVICDEAPAFTSQLMKSYVHALNIKLVYISSSNDGSHRYNEVMKKRREKVSRLVKKRKKVESETQYIMEMRRHPNEKMFRVGDLVFLDYEGGFLLRAPSKKLNRDWIGPLEIHQVLDNIHYVVSDWDEKFLSPKIHINRLKRCMFNLYEIGERGQLNVASNVRDLFCKWEEVLNMLKGRNDSERQKT